MRPMAEWSWGRATAAAGAIALAGGVLLTQRRTVNAVAERIAGGDGQELLAMAAAGLAGCAALIAVLAHDRHTEPFWMVLVFYALVLVPAGNLSMRTLPDPDWDLLYDMALVVLVVLTIAPVLRRRLVRPANRWWVLCAVAVALGVGVLEQGLPARIEDTLVEAVPTTVLEVGWLLSALCVAARGMALGHGPLFLLGTGLSVLAANHLAWRHDGLPNAPLDTTFGLLRAIALAIILTGLGRRWIYGRREVQWREHVQARRTAERRHEIHNVLTGLEGVGYLMRPGARTPPGAEPGVELGTAVSAELSRLADLVAEREGHPGPTRIAPVVVRCGSLRRAAGDDVEVVVRPGADQARTRMPEAALAQVVTNLLLNCHRHAPGARVRIEVARTGGCAVVTVTDDGPGLDAAARTAPGLPGPGPSDAHGLGLGIVRSLLEAHGGALRLGPGTGGRGTRAAVTLPLAGPTGAGSRPTAARTPQ